MMSHAEQAHSLAFRCNTDMLVTCASGDGAEKMRGGGEGFQSPTRPNMGTVLEFPAKRLLLFLLTSFFLGSIAFALPAGDVFACHGDGSITHTEICNPDDHASVTTIDLSGVVYMPGGVKPDGDVAQIKLDRDGYVALNPCLAKMQAAMRAMDRFVQGLIISTDLARTVWQPGAQQQFNAAKKQWDASESECWRQP